MSELSQQSKTKGTKMKAPKVPIKMEPPTNWLKMVENIRRIRQVYPAPVDSMGCGDHGNTKSDKDIYQRFHILVSLMLSSQTKDPITWAAVQKLKQNGLGTPQAILEAPEKDIEELIYPVGFYRRKAVYLKQVAKRLLENYQGDIPQTIDDLCSLPGVGPKMAHLCMQEAWNVNSGIGVDTHVHRIAARLGWVPREGIKTPEDTRKALESWLPSDYWREINHLLVGFGQTICQPTHPRCADCLNNEICPKLGTDVRKRKRQQTKIPASQETITTTTSSADEEEEEEEEGDHDDDHDYERKPKIKKKVTTTTRTKTLSATSDTLLKTETDDDDNGAMRRTTRARTKKTKEMEIARSASIKAEVKLEPETIADTKVEPKTSSSSSLSISQRMRRPPIRVKKEPLC